MQETTTVLANISRAKQALAQARDFNDILDIRDAAVAAEAWATARGADEAARIATEIKLRSERRAGEFLQEMPEFGRRGGDRKSSNNMLLDDIGVSKIESSRWQRIASIPDERFENYLINAKKRTQAALLQEAARQIKSESKEEETVPFPDKKYHCLVIDPPWPAKKIERFERPNQGQYYDYPSMSIDEIEKIPISELANESGCHVYLWTTQKYLPVALYLFQHWDVNYQCLLTWVKPSGITPFSWMYNTEHVLFGRIGTLKLNKLGIKLSFEASTREHSRKPDTFYDIVRQVSPNPRLELFARERREGFEAWGNEVDKFG